ncbi:type II toxin-antitoxin system VapC family toxin [uncultured Sphingomonas sp.]|uniref:type II toxin-antitoxin system VapC family toxin n=1 Tax=uncultured Sphingomonas sp. TaxID=158754 RepID=UPI0037488729
MTVFVDASVIVAILNNEDDALGQAARLASCADPVTSPIACWEATIVVAKRRSEDMALASRRVQDLLTAADVRTVSIGTDEMRAAIDAFERYGKGRHDAQLNMGDCFAYACARTNGAKLLYKDDDFSKTDLA